MRPGLNMASTWLQHDLSKALGGKPAEPSSGISDEAWPQHGLNMATARPLKKNRLNLCQESGRRPGPNMASTWRQEDHPPGPPSGTSDEAWPQHGLRRGGRLKHGQDSRLRPGRNMALGGVSA